MSADKAKLLEKASELTEEAAELASDIAVYSAEVARYTVENGGGSAISPVMMSLTVFVLACFVGYYVVWKVTPALHSPLMGVTNAISSVIIVGALIAAGPESEATSGFSRLSGFLAVTLASVNIFGGFIVTQRMLHMFRKK